MSDYFGESGGRSRNNPVKPTARRRNSAAERSQRTHLHDDPEAWPATEPPPWWSRPTRRGWIVAGVAAFVVVFLATWASSGICWTGDGVLGYGRCPWMP